MPGVGACAIFGADDTARVALVWCRSAFRPPPDLVWAPGEVDHGNRLGRAISYSPFPAELRLNPAPVDDDYQAMAATSTGAVIIKTARPVAHVRTDVDVRDVRLGDFEFGVGGQG